VTRTILRCCMRFRMIGNGRFTGIGWQRKVLREAAFDRLNPGPLAGAMARARAASSYPHPALRATFSRWEKGSDRVVPPSGGKRCLKVPPKAPPSKPWILPREIDCAITRGSGVSAAVWPGTAAHRRRRQSTSCR
jgi:hypothetical protein